MSKKQYLHFGKVLVLLLVLFLLAACGSSEAEVSEPQDTAPAAEEEAAPVQEEAAPEEAPAAEEAVTIDFWIPAGRGRDEGTAAVVEAFEAQNPNIQVEVNAIPFNEFASALQVAYAGDAPPDAALINGVEIQNLAFNGALMPVGDLVSGEDEADFMADLVEMVSLDGEKYAVPWAQASIGMYYNKDLFEAAGIDVPQELEDVWTWAEYKEAIEAVVANEAGQENEVWGVVGLQAPIQGAFFSWNIVRSFSEPGSPLWESIAPDWSTVAGYIDTDEAMEGYEFYQSLYTDSLAPRDAIPDAFGNGTAATYMAIPPTGNTLNKNFPDLNWGVMPLPYGKTPITHTGSFAPGIAAKSDNPEEAKKFVQYVTSPEGYLTYHAVTPIIPARKSLQAELPELQEGYLAFLFDEAIEWGVSRPGGPAHSIFNVVVAINMMTDIALGADINEAVEAAVSETDAQLIQFR